MTSPLALLLLPIIALAAVGCGSDGESVSSEPVEAATTQPATTEPATTEPATTEPATTEPAATDSTGPASTEAEAPLAGGIEVDDDPVCQAFARLIGAQVFQGLAGSFGSEDGAVEKIELFFAPALAPDVVVIRTQGAAEFQAFPTLARIEAGNVALTAGGFTEEELAALAASGDDTIDSLLAGNAPDLEGATAPEAETKLAAAAAAYLAEVGTIDEFNEANADPAAEAAFATAFPAQCPILVASLDSF
ncbi:MAG TPA: hypothetical protein VES40_01600 [Ilumatobacteraceae bacterium]|nr:hypothetical protein [Ilumatobacteraceae bacterium]